MKILLLIFFIAIASCQSKTCDCEAFIDWESDKKIILYSDSRGENEIVQLQNDIKNEDFLIIKILEANDDFFKVEIGLGMQNETTLGWIRKTKEISIYARNYSENEILNLHNKPDKNSKVKSSLDDNNQSLYSIIDCNNNWVYVKTNYNNTNHEGWLEPFYQCSNPYTTCN